MRKAGSILVLTATMLCANETNIMDISRSLDMIKEASHIQETISKIDYDPFYSTPKKKVKPVENKTITKKTSKAAPKSKLGLELSMILNKNALISGKWYKENSKVADYVLTKVNSNSVILRKKHKSIKLKLYTKSELLKIKRM